MREYANVKRVGLNPTVCPFESDLAHASMPSWGNPANPPRSDRGEPTGKCAFESRRGYQQHPLLAKQVDAAASRAAAERRPGSTPGERTTLTAGKLIQA